MKRHTEATPQNEVVMAKQALLTIHHFKPGFFRAKNQSFSNLPRLHGTRNHIVLGTVTRRRRVNGRRKRIQNGTVTNETVFV